MPPRIIPGGVLADESLHQLILHSCRLAGTEPSAYLQRVTPTMLLHATGRKRDIVLH